MKKIFSILLSIMMLAAVFHFSIAAHYCEGIEVATKVSLTGKLADCGMENPKNEGYSGTILTRHCCDNYLSYLGVCSNYIPSFSFAPVIFHQNFEVFAIPVKYSVSSFLDLVYLHTDTSPPGAFWSTDVDLSDICIFRI